MRIIHAIQAAILLFLFTSCAVTSEVSNDVTYTSDSFSVKALNDEGLSLLPVVADRGVESYRRPLGNRINEVGDSLFKNFTGWNETLQTLNNTDLVSNYNSAIQSYQQTSVIDYSLLKKLSEATGHKYFMYVQLGTPTSEDDYDYNDFTGFTSSETNSISASALIWGSEEGDVVWEGFTTAEVTTGDFSYTDETDFDRVQKIAESLIEGVYYTRNISYPEAINRKTRQ